MEYVMYLIVRTDLKMSKGKIAAQCGHAVQKLILGQVSSNLLNNYINSVHPKICLKINTEQDMDEIALYCKNNNIYHSIVIDVGRTQVPPNSKTVLGVGPILRSEVPDIIKNLKLL